MSKTDDILDGLRKPTYEIKREPKKPEGEQEKCPECKGRGLLLNFQGDHNGDEYTCPICKGTGLKPLEKGKLTQCPRCKSYNLIKKQSNSNDYCDDCGYFPINCKYMNTNKCKKCEHKDICFTIESKEVKSSEEEVEEILEKLLSDSFRIMSEVTKGCMGDDKLERIDEKSKKAAQKLRQSIGREIIGKALEKLNKESNNLGLSANPRNWEIKKGVDIAMQKLKEVK